MVKVVGVRFKKAGKIYYFDPGDLEINLHENVIVETARGIEFGQVVVPNTEVSEEEIVAPLKKVIRVATEEDKAHHEDNIRREKEAFDICLQKIANHKLEMKLVGVEYTFDNNKILFYFTADGRVDFRELVKDLASVFRTRIELRQIGVRDEAKMMGGLGVCGRVLCCNSFLGEFQPVSIKMAKEQGLSLNPAKISGACGRLMCCLKYEQEAYEEIISRVPKEGAIVETPDGQGVVMSVSLLKELVKVKLDRENETDLKVYKASEVKVIKDVTREETEEEEIDLDELKQLED
ncbi:MAG TPA: stage 0 sporulation protein [Hungateiclostridium thermocellum]|jgi:cell fate regulator YaaT (PSP1 superfamily)|uniref:PSP1 domain protein n=2 Tax=Acetivibrio thermocellus TaxID=1515 RepID=A3DH82_ACET2|nr:stage 0 sporulation family protein [Acetivibrio thermocellus]CDG36606.1 Stage 0 sporulation protein YaaT [Acetivibrio thermocellus BC1]ABN53311.1 PSP1 domain protein [Acetivibrio thermocellus ATCC 27405]ADU75746.1 PSP1 domain protein [Acetivibrio thermocellus DSM 1313]ALX09776.1 PSP1 domain protein [Acetivibrio thermocellus AD2]ANV77550.1 PSP1 domain protein [Acetivibrio thermocellus DSM 2360]